MVNDATPSPSPIPPPADASRRTRLYVVPVSSTLANEYVRRHHRHNRPVEFGAVFNAAVCDDAGIIRGVLIAGRPVARALCDGWTLEVLRTCTDGAPNANSMLYGAAWRAAKALGYRRLVTYTQHSETGASLRASGFRQVASLSSRRGWDTPSRRRDNTVYPSADRWRWEIATSEPPSISPTLPPLDEGEAAQPALFDDGAA